LVHLNLPGQITVDLEGTIRKATAMPAPRGSKAGTQAKWQVGVQFQLAPDKRNQIENLLKSRVQHDDPVGLKRKGT
jgi:hypothetical protein